jgi:hypothetical protein
MKKYFVFKDTISGWSYFWRMWVQFLLIAALGLGFYLLFVTSYKRASAMTEKKWLIILATPTLPFVSIFFIVINNFRGGASWILDGGTIFSISYFFYFIMHFWFLFFDGRVIYHEG